MGTWARHRKGMCASRQNFEAHGDHVTVGCLCSVCSVESLGREIFSYSFPSCFPHVHYFRSLILFQLYQHGTGRRPQGRSRTPSWEHPLTWIIFHTTLFFPPGDDGARTQQKGWERREVWSAAGKDAEGTAFAAYFPREFWPFSKLTDALIPQTLLRCDSPLGVGPSTGGHVEREQPDFVGYPFLVFPLSEALQSLARGY